MDWIRFDKKLPPEDTTVMVSNGPSIGHYHFKMSTYLAHTGNKQTCGVQPQVTIPLWDLAGKRSEVAMIDVIQWSELLPAPKKEVVKLSKWQRAVQKMKRMVGS